MAGVPGSQPQNLANPVPGEDKKRDIATEFTLSSEDFISALNDAGQVAVDAAGEVQDAAMGAQNATREDVPATGENFVLNDEDFTAAMQDASSLEPENVDFGEELGTGGFREVMDRLRAGLADSTENKETFFKKLYGKDKVRRRGDKLYLKPPGREKFIPYDSDQWSMFLDLVDETRTFIESGIEMTAEGAGLVGGAVAGSTGGLAGTVVGGARGYAIAGAMGAVIGKTAADLIAEMAGVETATGDLARGEITPGTFAKQIAITAGLGAAFNAGAAKLTGKLVKKDPSNAFENTLREIDEIEAAANALKEQGILEPDKIHNSVLLPQQVIPDTLPEAQQAFKDFSKDPRVGEYMLAQEKRVTDAVDKMLKRAQVMDERTATNRVLKQASTIRKYEGSLIGDYRDYVSSLNIKDPALNTQKFLSDNYPAILEEGASINRIVRETISDIEAPKIERALREVKKLSEGNKTLKETLKVYDSIGKQIDSTGASQTGVIRALSQIRKAVRDDTLDMIQRRLPDDEAVDYAQRLTRFKEIASGMDNLKSLFKKDEMTSRSVAKYVFDTQAGDNLQRLKSFKSLFSKDDPRLLIDLRNQYMSEILEESGGGLKGSKGLVTRLRKLGPEMLKELFPDNPQILSQMSDASKVISAIKKESIDAPISIDQQVEQIGLLMAITNVVWATSRAAYRAMSGMVTSSKVDKFLSESGTDMILKSKGIKRLSGSQADKRRAINKLKEYALRGGVLKPGEVEAREQLNE
jgi:hypothetical protein